MSARRDTAAHEGNWYVLVFGLPRPESPLTLAPGLSLVPLASPLSVFDLAAVGAAGFREWALLEPLAPGCTCEIETAKDSEILPGYDVLNRAWLASALLGLRGFTSHLSVACCAYSWSTVAGRQGRTADVFKKQMADEGVDAAIHHSKRALPPFKGGLLDFHTRLLVDQNTRTDGVSPEDVEWIREHYGTFNTLCSESEAFRLALESAIDWRYSKEPRLAIGRIWSGIEAIFGVETELAYRISGLCAGLLEERGSSRVARFHSTKTLYRARSKAVHGAPMSDDRLVGAMNDSYQLLRDLLLLTIETGHVLGEADFDQALFG